MRVWQSGAEGFEAVSQRIASDPHPQVRTELLRRGPCAAGRLGAGLRRTGVRPLRPTPLDRALLQEHVPGHVVRGGFCRLESAHGTNIRAHTHPDMYIYIYRVNP